MYEKVQSVWILHVHFRRGNSAERVRLLFFLFLIALCQNLQYFFGNLKLKKLILSS